MFQKHGWLGSRQVCSDLGQVKWRQISSQLWEQAPTLFQKLAWFTIKIIACGYGSIPIDTIFSGMNIHLPAILGFTRYQGFDPSPCPKNMLNGNRSLATRLGLRFSCAPPSKLDQVTQSDLGLSLSVASATAMTHSSLGFRTFWTWPPL